MNAFALCFAPYSVRRSWGSLSFLPCPWLGKGDDELITFVIVITRKKRRVVGSHRQHSGQQLRQIFNQVKRFEPVLFDPLERAFRRRPGIAPQRSCGEHEYDDARFLTHVNIKDAAQARSGSWRC